MDGLETARQLWRRWGNNATKVVAISASVLDHERRGYLEAGFDAFVEKPCHAEGIYACLAQLLGVNRTPGAVVVRASSHNTREGCLRMHTDLTDARILLVDDQPTNRPTDQPTNRPT